MISLTTPLTKDKVATLKAGDMVQITGTIYTARDAAHKRLWTLLDEGKPLPFDVKNQIIYYVGPTPTAPGKIIGSAGPTTSMRMDAYTPRLYDLGLSASMGKGYRTQAIVDSCVKNQCIYLVALGGAGALLSKCITKAEVIAFDDLGPEAIHKLEVKNFPATVCIDVQGNNLYQEITKKL